MGSQKALGFGLEDEINWRRIALRYRLTRIGIADEPGTE
jgi:hypothetical protein